MTEFDPRDFRESIDDMCDEAFRRMFAITESGSAAFLQDGDHYFSYISLDSATGDKLDAATHLETEICEIHERLATNPSPTTLEMLAGAALTLEKYSTYAGAEPTSLSLTGTVDEVMDSLEDRLLLSRAATRQREEVALSAYTHSAFGELSLMLEPSDDDMWRLSYHSLRHMYIDRKR